LRQAITRGGFEVYYQQVLDLETGKVSCCEALLRWRHPERGAISPAEFIPVAEETGLINELGRWVLETACTEAMNWPDHIRVAVNVSPVQFKGQTLALNVAAALAAFGLGASRLELEITEAVLIRDDEIALDALHQLRKLGVRIALDDFGTGYSSLSYLQRFPFDKIKIDRAFIKDLAGAGASSSIVQAVVNIAAASDMTRRRKAWRPSNSAICCTSSAAPRCRDICSARRFLPRKSVVCCFRIAVRSCPRLETPVRACYPNCRNNKGSIRVARLMIGATVAGYATLLLFAQMQTVPAGRDGVPAAGRLLASP